MDPDQTQQSKINSKFKVVIGVSVFVGVFALILSVVALVLYATVPQPITPTLKHITVEAVASTTTVTFTPSNYTYYTVNKATTTNNKVVIGIPDKRNYFYSIYNSSTTIPLNVYNKSSTDVLTIIPPGKASVFLVIKNGSSVVINNSLYYQP